MISFAIKGKLVNLELMKSLNCGASDRKWTFSLLSASQTAGATAIKKGNTRVSHVLKQGSLLLSKLDIDLGFYLFIYFNANSFFFFLFI